MPAGADLTRAYEHLVRIFVALSRETDLPALIHRILTEARSLTSAEAGTLYLLEDDRLHFAVVQNDSVGHRLGPGGLERCLEAEPLRLDEPSLAAHVALTGDILNLHDPYMIPPDRPYRFDGRADARCEYRTRSVLVVPLPDPSGKILGVLQLINALDRHGAVVPFDSGYEALVRSLASQAAVAIRNARLEAQALKDPSTDAYHRRYLLARIEEECRRHARSGAPVSLVVLELDQLGAVTGRLGERGRDDLLAELARLLLRHSRDFTVVGRYGADEFASLLIGTARTGALAYAERIRGLIEGQPFSHGAVTASLGVASLPEDGAGADDLVQAAERAVAEAKRLGCNRTATA